MVLELPRGLSSVLLALLIAASPAAVSPALASAPLGATAGGPPPASATIFPYPWQQKTLANGLKIVVIPMPSDGLVSYRTVVRTGSRDEVEKGATGFAHFFEHMVFRGTKKYPADAYNEIVTRMGADSNAYTSSDMTVYEFDIVKDDLETVVEIESDRFMNLDYSKQGFETEAGAVYGEYRKNRSSPFFVLYEAVRAAAFDRHTYAHTTIGFVEDIKAMPSKYDYSRDFFRRFYRPENCVIVVAGDVEAEPTFALIEQYYGGWAKGYVAPKIKAEKPQKQQRELEVEYDGRSLPRIWIGYRGPAFTPEDRIYVASMVLAEIAFGETSDIVRELRLEQQKVESLGVGAATNRDPELWSVIATVKDEADIDAVLARIDQTIARYREELPDAARVDAVKSHMRYQYLLGLDTPSAVAGQVASFIGTAGDLARVEQLYQNLQAVTPEDVREAARRWLVDDQRTVAILREAKAKSTEAATEKGAQ